MLLFYNIYLSSNSSFSCQSIFLKYNSYSFPYTETERSLASLSYFQRMFKHHNDAWSKKTMVKAVMTLDLSRWSLRFRWSFVTVLRWSEDPPLSTRIRLRICLYVCVCVLSLIPCRRLSHRRRRGRRRLLSVVILGRLIQGGPKLRPFSLTADVPKKPQLVCIV